MKTQSQPFAETDSETTALLSTSKSDSESAATSTRNSDDLHTANTPHCFEMQREYFHSDHTKKQKIINGMNPKRKHIIATSLGLAIYAVQSFVALVFPVVWFGYIWIYQVIVEGTKTVLVEHDAQSLYYWIIGAVYTLMFVICMVNIGVSAGRDIWTRIYAAIFVWNFEELNSSNVHTAKQILLTMPTVATMLESEKLDKNVTMMILNYLF